MKATSEAIRIEQNENATAPKLRVTLAEISAVKRGFIERNMLLTLDEAGAIFGKSGRWALDRVKDGSFIAADEFARKGKGGCLQASQGVRVTPESVEAYRKSIVISPELWHE